MRWTRRRWSAADFVLAAAIVVLVVAVAVNSVADVRQNRRPQLEQQVMNDYLVTYAGGAAQFGSRLYVRQLGATDLVCAFLRHSNGGLCLHIVRGTRRIAAEYACVNLPARGFGGPPPKGRHWCPYHPKKVI